jgi:hypothetical protein
MLDTVIVAFNKLLTDDQFSDWVPDPGKNTVSIGPKTYKKYLPMKNGASFSAVYHPPHPIYKDKPWLGIQVSIPAVVFGKNIEMITDISQIDEAILRVNKFTSELNWLPEIDFGAGPLYRLDSVYNHQVGEYVEDYIQAFSNLECPTRQTIHYLHSGVLFKGGVISTTMYSKHLKSKSPLAKGILRQETKIITPDYIEQKTGLHRPTLRDLTIPGLAKILQQDLVRLRLNDVSLHGRSNAQHILTNKYKYNLALTLYGYLINRQSMSMEEMIAQGGNPRTLRNYEKLIHDAGLSIALVEDGITLPPLEIILPVATACRL